MGYLIDTLSKIVDLCFVVNKLAKFLSNNGKLNFEGLLQLLRYIRDSKNLGLVYYAKIEDAPLSTLLRQDNIHNENQLVVYYYSNWQECTDTISSTGAYIVFFKLDQLIISHMFQV